MTPSKAKIHVTVEYNRKYDDIAKIENWIELFIIDKLFDLE